MRSTNRILAHLSQDDFSLLEPHLVALDLPLRARLAAPKRLIRNAYFVESGMASIVAFGNPDVQTEVAVVGSEGVSNCSVILGVDRTPQDIYMQVAGSGQQISVQKLHMAMEISPTLRWTLTRYVHTAIMQRDETSLVNAKGSIQTRLARWLLMADDRTIEKDMPLTHEFLALMLGIQRSGVTIALQKMNELELTDHHRGHVKIRSRPMMERFAGGFYGAAEREYDRLFPTSTPSVN